MKTIELVFFGEQPAAVGRKYFADVQEARAWAEKVLRRDSKAFCCVIYEKDSLSEQLYTNGREIIRLLEPWVLSRRQARRLYLEAGQVRGLPQRYMAYE
ncbi:MAG: hypothetical protein WAU81_15985 [Candidatus Aminicenantales bacterium]